MMIVIFVGQPAAVGEYGGGEIVVCILIIGDSALDIGDGGNIAVVIIGIACAKGFLIEGDAVEDGGIYIVVVGQLQGDLGILARGDQGPGGVLPASLDRKSVV